jgi:RNA polymerase sigma-54 factor
MELLYHSGHGTHLATGGLFPAYGNHRVRHTMLQVQDHSLRPLTTAHLAQTMTLLSLSNLELRDRVLGELASNPALELIEQRVCPTCHRLLRPSGQCPTCSARQESDGPIVFLSPRESARRASPPPLGEELPEQEPAAPEELPIYVLGQLAADLKPEERQLAAYILSSLDEDGFLQDPLVLIARATGSLPFQVQHVQELISHADPPGLATSGPRQALLAQLDLLQEIPQAELARSMIECCFTELGRHEFERIAERLGVSVRRAREAAAFIQDNLNPYPARAFWGAGRQPQSGDPNIYHAPDIQISNAPNGENQLVVEIFSPVSGWLRVNPLFRKATRQTDGEISEAWSKHLERASLFVKCLQQRNNTMRRLMRILADAQRQFILEGDRFLKPMTRAALAEQIGVHESTISRAVAHKSIALPDGRIIPLTKFFDRSLSVRDRIREMVSQEAQPMTDDEIAAALAAEGIKVARRTVAKYRAIEGILPARLRHHKADRASAQVS